MLFLCTTKNYLLIHQLNLLVSAVFLAEIDAVGFKILSKLSSFVRLEGARFIEGYLPTDNETQKC